VALRRGVMGSEKRNSVRGKVRGKGFLLRGDTAFFTKVQTGKKKRRKRRPTAVVRENRGEGCEFERNKTVEKPQRRVGP